MPVTDAFGNVGEPQCIRIKHRAAKVARKSVAAGPDDVNVRGAERNAFAKNYRTDIDQRQDASLDNLFVADLTAHKVSLGSKLFDQACHFWIRRRLPAAILHLSSPEPVVLN